MKPLDDEIFLRHLSALCAGEDELDMAGPNGLGDLFPCGDVEDLDTVADLIDYAGKIDLGFALNSGWRCDVAFDMFSAEVCDRTFPRAEHFDVRAVTAFGALAGGILAALQNRAKAAHRPLYEASFKLLSGEAGQNLGFAEYEEALGRSLSSRERDAYHEIRGGLLAVLKQPDEMPGVEDVKAKIAEWWRIQNHPSRQDVTVTRDPTDPDKLTVCFHPMPANEPGETAGDS